MMGRRINENQNTIFMLLLTVHWQRSWNFSNFILKKGRFDGPKGPRSGFRYSTQHLNRPSEEERPEWLPLRTDCILCRLRMRNAQFALCAYMSRNTEVGLRACLSRNYIIGSFYPFLRRGFKKRTLSWKIWSDRRKVFANWEPDLLLCNYRWSL